MGQYMMVDYSNTTYGMYQQPFVPSYMPYTDYSADANLNQLKRSLKCLNLV